MLWTRRIVAAGVVLSRCCFDGAGAAKLGPSLPPEVADEDFYCDRIDHALIDWGSVAMDLLEISEEKMLSATEPNAKAKLEVIYWERIRPQMHTLDNLASHTVDPSIFRPCLAGYYAVRSFVAAVGKDSMDLEAGIFRDDWNWFVGLPDDLFKQLPCTHWGRILFISWYFLAAREQREADEASLAAACGEPCLPAIAEAFMTAGRFPDAKAALAHIPNEDGRALLRAFRMPADWITTAPEACGEVANQRMAQRTRDKCRRHQCTLREAGTPRNLDCVCEQLFPSKKRSRMCIFMVDSRPLQPLSNITEILAARFWSLAYEANRLYAEHHGYSLEYIIPDKQLHFPERKVGWAKVAVITDAMLERPPEAENGCDFGVSIDTDAYFRSTESLDGVVEAYMDGKEIFFSQEYHTELDPNNTFINGGFFIVRNSPRGRQLLAEWYSVPELPEWNMYKKENPQGLNYCWDSVMHGMYADLTVLAPPELFSCPRGRFIAHNWFKDLRFEMEMHDVIFQRRLETNPGCVLCDEVHLVETVRARMGVNSME